MDSYPQGKQGCSLNNSASWIWGIWFTVTRLPRTRATSQGFVSRRWLRERAVIILDRIIHKTNYSLMIEALECWNAVANHKTAIPRNLQFRQHVIFMAFCGCPSIIIIPNTVQSCRLTDPYWPLLLFEWFFRVTLLEETVTLSATPLQSENLKENVCTKEENSTRRLKLSSYVSMLGWTLNSAAQVTEYGLFQGSWVISY